MARWLVTGGCGFIGSHLVEALLRRGDQVLVLDDLSTGKRANIPANVPIRVGDVANPELVAEAMRGVDGCFHLAAVASVQRGNEDWLGTHRANLTGAICVFDQARRCNPAGPVPVIYASSAAVYGDNPEIPLGETAPIAPLSAYGSDKAGCELHGRVAWHVHGVPTTGFRFFNVYGPRQDPKSPYSGVIAIFADRIAAGQSVEIHGDGLQVRDFVFVADVVRFLLAAMDRRASGASVFNVCTGRPTTILDLAAYLGQIAGRTPRLVHGAARTGDIRVSLGDPTLLGRTFGLTANTAVADGLRKTFAALAGAE